MKEQILEILDNKLEEGFCSILGTKSAASEIASMMTEFLIWKEQNFPKSNSNDKYLLWEDHLTLDELFQYWLKEFKTKAQ